MIKVFYIICVFFLVSFNGLKSEILPICHPIHVSIVNMDLFENKVHFSVKLFTDDFQTIINTKYKAEYVFDKNIKIDEVRKDVRSYIFEHLRLGLENLKDGDYKLVNMKFNHEAIWLFFELELSSELSQDLKVKNTLMTDLYDDQTNLFILNHNGKDKAFSYNNSDIDYTFVLNK